MDETEKIGYSYDTLGRRTERILNTGAPFTTEYTYQEGISSEETTELVKTIKNGIDTLTYTYDTVGNITNIKENGTTIGSYTYDSLGQLTKAVYNTNIWTYSYDNGGNLTDVKMNGRTQKRYTYGDSNWKDKLTAFNDTAITYDEIGNPLSYRDGFQFTWQNGRRLATVTKGTNSISYSYNVNGLRTMKNVNGTVTEYYWMGDTLLGERTGNEYIYYLYDESGIPYGILLKNGSSLTYYYYIYNLQGDVIGILDANGIQVVSYEYGPWGDILFVTGSKASTIGQKNPIRYRGYYYDAETGFYYLRSRYYDVVTYRFLNADGYVSVGQGILGDNMYTYCSNNPVNYKDPTGTAYCHVCDSPAYNKLPFMCPVHDKGKQKVKCVLDTGQTIFESVSDIGDGVHLGLELKIYSIANESRPNNIQPGVHFKNVNQRLGYVNGLMKQTDDFFGELSKVGDYWEISTNVYDNLMNNASQEKILWDLTVDVTFNSINSYVTATAASVIGAYVGTMILPGFGSVAGSIAGIVIGIGIDLVSSKYKEEIKAWVN